MAITNINPSNGNIDLTEEIIKEFRLAKVFHHNGATINITSLEFDGTGEFCLVGCSGDESIALYNCYEGELVKRVYSKKYGVGPLCFTHRPTTVIYSSTKGGDKNDNIQASHTLRYLSLHDNAYLRYYRGHERPVTALVMSPRDDTFISGAAHDTVRIWDLRTPWCQGVLAINGTPLVAIDPMGLIFALALDNRFIRLFDLKNYERGPFACFEIIDRNQTNSVEWCSLSFSPDGKELLIGTKSDVLYLIDSFDGMVKRVFIRNQNSMSLPLQPTITPDNRYIMSGNEDGSIWGWNRETGKTIARFEGHTTAPLLVKFNPRLALMASAASSTLAFWQPSPYQ